MGEVFRKVHAENHSVQELGPTVLTQAWIDIAYGFCVFKISLMIIITLSWLLTHIMIEKQNFFCNAVLTTGLMFFDSFIYLAFSVPHCNAFEASALSATLVPWASCTQETQKA